MFRVRAAFVSFCVLRRASSLSQRQRIQGAKVISLVPVAVAQSPVGSKAQSELEDEIVALRDCDNSLDGIRVLFDTYRPQVPH